MSTTKIVTIALLFMFGCWLMSGGLTSAIHGPAPLPEQVDKGGFVHRVKNFIGRMVGHAIVDEMFDAEPPEEANPQRQALYLTNAPALKPSEFRAKPGEELKHGEGW